MSKKSILISGTLLAGLGVALGAVGAHALQDILIQNGRSNTFETAVRYQLYHAFGLLVVGLLINLQNQNRLGWVAFMFLMGSTLFSGSLYLLSLTSLQWVVYVTPVGGMLMIGGWILLLLHFLKMKE